MSLKALFFAVAILAIGCSGTRTVVQGWTGSTAARDSLVSAVAERLGYAPDTIQQCTPRKLRVVFSDRPGELPVRNVRRPDGTFVLYLPAPAVDRNLVRAIAYALQSPLRDVGVDTVVITLHRTPTPRGDNGPLRASFLVSVEALRDSIGDGSNDAATILPVVPYDKPCTGSPLRRRGT
jgi:hypothetical protein